MLVHKKIFNSISSMPALFEIVLNDPTSVERALGVHLLPQAVVVALAAEAWLTHLCLLLSRPHAPPLHQLVGVALQPAAG